MCLSTCLKTSTPPEIFFILLNSPTVFVKCLLRVELFVDILYIFVNGTSRAIFWALSEINKLIRDPSRAESVPHFVTFFHIYRCICQKLLFYWTYCHILYMICYSHTLLHLLPMVICSLSNIEFKICPQHLYEENSSLRF